MLCPATRLIDRTVGALLHKTNRVIKDDTVGKEAVEELESQRDSMIDTSYEAEKYALRRALQSGELDGGEMTVMEESGSFQSVTVWGHESTPKTGEDPYIRGIKEWMSFAAAVSFLWQFITPSTRSIRAD